MKFILSQVFPDICPACHSCLLEDKVLCTNCLVDLAFIPGPACKICAGLTDSIDLVCSTCQETKRSWQAASSSFLFQGLARELIHRFKFQNDVALTRPLASIAAESLKLQLQDRSFNLVTPVPLHWFREFQRGYNQAELLAKEIASELDIEFRRTMRRRRWTGTQAHLSKSKREANLRNAFFIREKKSIAGSNILLVDDDNAAATSKRSTT